MGRGRRENAPAGRRRQTLQIGSLSRHQPRENNPRASELSGVQTPPKTSRNAGNVATATHGQGFSLLGAYDASGSEDEGIDDQVKDFLKGLEGDEPASGTAKDDSVVSAPEQAAPAPLSAEWQELLDPTSGHRYYWNTVTNEVSWTLPEAMAASTANASAGVADSAAGALSTAGSGSRGAVDDSPHAQQEDTDDEMMVDDDSDCNIENYDEDEEDIQTERVSRLQQAFPTVSTAMPVDDAEIDASVVSTRAVTQFESSHQERSPSRSVGSCSSSQPAVSRDSSRAASPALSETSASVKSEQSHAEKVEDTAVCGTSSATDTAIAESSLPASSHASSRSQSPSGSLHEDTDSDCNFEQYDEEEEEDNEMDDTLTMKSPQVKTIPSDEKEQVIAPSQGNGLEDMLFMDVSTAEKFGFKRLAAESGGNSPSSEMAEKSRPLVTPRSLALKPRSVATKRLPSPKGEASPGAKIVPASSEEQATSGTVDIFADEAVTASPAADPAPASKLQSEDSSTADQDDLGDFDIDAALEESLENAQGTPGDFDIDAALDESLEIARSKPDKRPHQSRSSDTEEEYDDAVAGEPPVKRLKPLCDTNAVSPPAPPEPVSDMEWAAESDVEEQKPIVHETNPDLTAARHSNTAKEVTADIIGDQLLTLASELSAKLKFLDITTNELSNLHLALVRAETRLADWQAGALDGAYAVRMLQSSVGELHAYEKACAPPGWTCLWDSSTSRYYYHDTTTGETRWEYPSESAKEAPQPACSETSLHQATAAMFAGAMAATYHGYIYGGYQLAGYAPTNVPTMPAGTTTATAVQGPYSAPPLPAEEPPPPPPGVDNPPPPVHSSPPPPPPPPEDDSPSSSAATPPPPPNDEDSAAAVAAADQPESTETSGDAASKTSSAVIIQAAAAITKRPAAEPVAEATVDISIEEEAIKASFEDPLQMRLRATLVAKGMNEAEINEYFVQEALKQQRTPTGTGPSSQPGSPRTSGKMKKEKKKKEKTKNLGSSGLVPKKKKNMTALVDKWSSIREKELEEEKADSEEDDPVRSQQRKIDEWKASQIAGGAANSNPNFEEVSGNWRDRVKRSKRPAV